MADKFLIELSRLRFFGTHGMYPEEMKVDNEFEVDLTLECKAPSTTLTSIQDTVNYVTLYEILQEEFQKRRVLLETLAMEIADRVEAVYPEAKSLCISIRKLSPPITNFSGHVTVSYTRKFK